MAAELWERTFPLEHPPDLRVVTDHAHVRLSTWNRPEIRIQVVGRGWRMGGPDGLRVSAEHDRARVRVEVLLPPWGYSPNWTSRSIDVVIRLPDSADVDIETEDADIHLPPLRGHIRARTWDGMISATGLAGVIEMRSGDGSVRAKELEGTVEAITDDGGLEVDGRFESLQLASRDGDIFARIAPGSRLGSEWTIESETGRIGLEIPNGLDAQIDATVTKGRIEFGERIERNDRSTAAHIRERLGEGGKTLRISSERGEIVIEQHRE